MESRQAIIMGASSGMGHRIAEILLEKGWRLGVAARREEMLLPLKEKYPGKVVTACIDVNDTKADELLLKMVEQMNGVDLYFHVSGIGKQNLTLEQEIEMNTVETNGTGFTRCITTMFNYMAKKPLLPTVPRKLSRTAIWKPWSNKPPCATSISISRTYVQDSWTHRCSVTIPTTPC